MDVAVAQHTCKISGRLLPILNYCFSLAESSQGLLQLNVLLPGSCLAVCSPAIKNVRLELCMQNLICFNIVATEIKPSKNSLK